MSLLEQNAPDDFRENVMDKVEKMKKEGYSEDDILLEVAGLVGPKLLEQQKSMSEFIEDNFNLEADP